MPSPLLNPITVKYLSAAFYEATVTITGNGMLWVRDLAAGATVQVIGYGKEREFAPQGNVRRRLSGTGLEVIVTDKYQRL